MGDRQQIIWFSHWESDGAVTIRLASRKWTHDCSTDNIKFIERTASRNMAPGRRFGRLVVVFVGKRVARRPIDGSCREPEKMTSVRRKHHESRSNVRTKKQRRLRTDERDKKSQKGKRQHDSVSSFDLFVCLADIFPQVGPKMTSVEGPILFVSSQRQTKRDSRIPIATM